MVGRFFPGARIHVDPGADAAGYEGLSDEYVIDAQSEIATNRTRAIIPPREMTASLFMQTIRVRESPILYML